MVCPASFCLYAICCVCRSPAWEVFLESDRSIHRGKHRAQLVLARPRHCRYYFFRFDTTLVSQISSKAFITESEQTIYSSTFLNGSMHQIAGYCARRGETIAPCGMESYRYNRTSLGVSGGSETKRSSTSCAGTFCCSNFFSDARSFV